jgi:phenylpyruvate tautomerase PptA (4-oxalocrotonate tautomerase family)
MKSVKSTKRVKEKLYQLFSRIFRREIIRDGFCGVLGRDPEVEAQSAYEGSFKEHGTGGLIRELSGSSEAWEKQKREHAEELIREAYLGVLGREPEEEALESYAGSFKELGTGGLIRELNGSSEAWERLLVSHSERIIGEFYCGILARATDKDGLASYKFEIERHKSLIPSLTRLLKSKEFKLKIGIGNDEYNKPTQNIGNLDISDIAEGIEKALFERTTTLVQKASIRSSIKEASSISVAVEEIKKAEWYLRGKKATSLIPEKLTESLKEKIVFLHIDKTAGTTIHEVFKKLYGHKNILLKHEDPLFRYSPEELDRFQVIGGHFNYDSIRYSALEFSKIIIFLRDPVRRFESLYNFWRSHDKTHENYVIFHELADTLSVEELILHPKMKESRLSWNHMTWAVMGETLWNQWRTELQGILDGQARIHYLEREVQPIMKNRLAGIYFIGEQETFEESMNSLIDRLGFARITRFERHNDTMENLTIKKGFKKDFRKLIFSEALSSKTAASLLELDSLLYSQFKKLDKYDAQNIPRI